MAIFVLTTKSYRSILSPDILYATQLIIISVQGRLNGVGLASSHPSVNQQMSSKSFSALRSNHWTLKHQIFFYMLDHEGGGGFIAVLFAKTESVESPRQIERSRARIATSFCPRNPSVPYEATTGLWLAACQESLCWGSGWQRARCHSAGGLVGSVPGVTLLGVWLAACQESLCWGSLTLNRVRSYCPPPTRRLLLCTG